MCKRNISNSAVCAFHILEKLYEKDAVLDDLADGFSDDTLRLYLNSLKNNGIKISSPNKRKREYSLEEGFDFLCLSSCDYNVLKRTKILLAQKSDYKRIVALNNFLEKIKKYVDLKSKKKLDEIISSKPFGIKLHKLLLQLEEYIKNKNTILIYYNSPSSSINFFKVLPQKIKIENSKIYLFCFDNQINKIRYLPLIRINGIKETDENFDEKDIKKFAVCKFKKQIGFSEFEECEILQQNESETIAKIYYENEFSFIQKIFSKGTGCKIISPADIKNAFVSKIETIKGLYE